MVVADLKLDAAQKLVDTIKGKGGEAAAVAVDVAKMDEVEKGRAVHGKPMAGSTWRSTMRHRRRSGSLGRLSFEDWHKVNDVTPQLRLLLDEVRDRAMLAGKGGAIVNIGVHPGLGGVPQCPAYVTAKHGVVGMTKSAAIDYARRASGSPPWAGFHRYAASRRRAEGAYDGLTALHPLGRLGAPRKWLP